MKLILAKINLKFLRESTERNRRRQILYKEEDSSCLRMTSDCIGKFHKPANTLLHQVSQTF